MKIRLIDGGIYRETMRRLRMPALVMLILATVFDAFILMLSALYNDYNTLYEMHPSLYVVPFAAPYLLTLMALHFHANRCDSDFYHALPFTRTTLTASMLAAVATWCAIIIGASSAVMAMFPIALGELTVGNTLIVMAATLVASLFMMTLTFVTTQLCGTKVSMAITVPILLFAPLLIKNVLFGMACDCSELLPPVDDAVIAPARYNLLYGGYQNGSAWLWTSLLTIVLLVVGLYMAKRRPSETAGNAAVHPVAQALIRLLLAFVCCLPSIQFLTYTHPDINDALLGYVFALVVYFLYELITTRSAKNVLRAIPWLSVLVVVNFVCVWAINVIVPTTVHAFDPTVDTVNSISLSSNTTFVSMNEEMTLKNEKGDWAHSKVDYAAQYDLVTEEPLFMYYTYGYGIYGYVEPGFYEWAELYDDSRCARARVKDDACIAMVCEAFARCKQDVENDRYHDYTVEQEAFGKEWATYEVVIEFHTGVFTRSRVVCLTETEYIQLLNAVNDVRPLPEYAFNYDAIV